MSLKYKKNIRNLTIFFYMYPMDTKKLYFKEGGGVVLIYSNNSDYNFYKFFLFYMGNLFIPNK
jgi:hypothetical protein